MPTSSPAREPAGPGLLAALPGSAPPEVPTGLATLGRTSSPSAGIDGAATENSAVETVCLPAGAACDSSQNDALLPSGDGSARWIDFFAAGGIGFAETAGAAVGGDFSGEATTSLCGDTLLGAFSSPV